MSNLKDIIEDIVCGECSEANHYCILKELLLLAPKDTRLLMQIKMIEKLKYIESEKDKKDIGWEEATKRWVESGKAKKFSDIWHPDIKIKELSKEMGF